MGFENLTPHLHGMMKGAKGEIGKEDHLI